jgi:hypothetical protein
MPFRAIYILGGFGNGCGCPNVKLESFRIAFKPAGELRWKVRRL